MEEFFYGIDFNLRFENQHAHWHQNQGSLFRFSKLQVKFNVILVCFCHFCKNLKDISFVRLGAVYKLRYAVEVGGWSAKYNHCKFY